MWGVGVEGGGQLGNKVKSELGYGRVGLTQSFALGDRALYYKHVSPLLIMLLLTDLHVFARGSGCKGVHSMERHLYFKVVLISIAVPKGGIGMSATGRLIAGIVPCSTCWARVEKLSLCLRGQERSGRASWH